MTPEEQEYIKSIAVIAAGAGALGGAIVGAFAILFNGWRQRAADLARSRKDIESANTRHLRGLALEAAIKSWDHQTWMWEHVKRPDQTMTFRPLDGFILHYMQMVDLLGDVSISPKDLSSRLAEIERLHPVMRKWEERPVTRTKKNEENEQAETRNPH